MPDSLTHWLTTLKDRATQLLIKYKSGALVAQFFSWLLQNIEKYLNMVLFEFERALVGRTTNRRSIVTNKKEPEALQCDTFHNVWENK